jgi:hypothetical protein
MAEQANSDELATFVSSTLLAIAKGITDAQGTNIRSAHGTGVSGFAAPREVEFDIAVSAKKAGTAEGGFKVQVFSIGANAGAGTSSESSLISRIKFTVPSHFKTTQSATDDDGGNWKTA